MAGQRRARRGEVGSYAVGRELTVGAGARIRLAGNRQLARHGRLNRLLGMSPEAATPAAKRSATKRVHHGDAIFDDYEWLASKDDPDTISFLEAENRYTEAMTAGQADLREAIFTEIKGRTQETDLSVPTRKGDWWYYARTIEGKQYRVQCRRAVLGADERPPMTTDGSPLDGEQVVLDGNKLAGDSAFFSLGVYNVSPDGTMLAYSTDYSGDERFTMRFKDLATGEVAAD